MRMRPHIDPLAGHELHRPHLVEEDEGSDHLALAMRQRAAHLETAEITRPRHDHEFERIAGVLVAKHRVPGRQPTHRPSRTSGRRAGQPVRIVAV